MIILYWILVYLVGATVLYSLDGWLDYDVDSGDLTCMSIFWPICIWFVVPVLLRRFFRNIRNRYM